jgi:hypothetical protein
MIEEGIKELNVKIMKKEMKENKEVVK